MATTTDQRPRNDLTGRRFGRLTVRSYVGRRLYKHNYINEWDCICDCGTACVRVQRALLDPGESSCGCAVRDANALKPDAGRGSVNALMCSYRIGARNRDLVFELSQESFRALTSACCHYCGVAPAQVIRNGKCAPYTYNGIDRVDNTIGYTPENVRACCGQCNTAKNTLGEQAFYQWIDRVHSRSPLRCEGAPIPSQDAQDIDAAHKVLRSAIGTPREELARAYLEIVVAKVKRRSEVQWRPA